MATTTSTGNGTGGGGDAAAARARRDRAVRQWILWGGALIILVMTYFSGVRAAGKRIREKDDQLKIVRQQWNAAQLDLTARYASLAQLEARRQVALALDDLDKRNFGSAQEKIARAASLLQDAAKPNTAAPDLSAVADNLAKVTLTPGANVGTDRAEIAALAARMDAALGDAVPPVLEAGKQAAETPPKLPTLNDIPPLPSGPVGNVR